MHANQGMTVYQKPFLELFLIILKDANRYVCVANLYDCLLTSVCGGCEQTLIAERGWFRPQVAVNDDRVELGPGEDQDQDSNVLLGAVALSQVLQLLRSKNWILHIAVNFLNSLLVSNKPKTEKL